MCKLWCPLEAESGTARWAGHREGRAGGRRREGSVLPHKAPGRGVWRAYPESVGTHEQLGRGPKVEALLMLRMSLRGCFFVFTVVIFHAVLIT